MKKILTWAIAGSIVLCFLAVGCGRKESKRKETVSIEWLRWPGGAEWEAAMTELVRRFEQTHPEIKVKMNTCSWKDYQQKLVTLSAGGNLPDIVLSNREAGFTPFLTQKGLLANLTPIIKKDKDFNLRDFYPCGIEAFTYNGGLYGLPIDLNPVVLFYNKDIFDKAGLPYPDKKLSKESLLNLAIKLTEDKNADGRPEQYGFVLLYESYIYWLMRAGVPMFNSDYTKVLLNTGKAEEILRFIADLRLKYKVVPSFSETKTMGIYEMFATGKIAMMEGIPAYINKLSENRNIHWDISFPIVLNPEILTNLPISGYSITKSTKHPNECWEFIKFMTSPSTCIFMRDRLSTIPPRISLVKNPKVLSPPPGNISVIPELLEHAILPPSFSKYPEFLDIANRKYEEVFLGLKSPAEALKEMEVEGNQLLKEESTGKRN